MKASRPEGDRSLAVFIDFENVGLGFGGRRDRFEIGKVLERIVEKGKIVAKKAYADWSRFGEYTRSLHEAAIELVEIPRRAQTGKNSADIRLVVDAIDLAYSKDHIDTFVIVSGDSDFSPLVSKLKELGKHVIGLGLADATSALLRDNCDEFIYYEDLDRAPIIPIATNENVPEQKRKVFALLLDSLLALRRENKEVILSSMVKDTMKRKKPSFNEGYFGYRTFSELLEDAQKEELLSLEKHKTSGMYVVTHFGLEMKTAAVPLARPNATPAAPEPRRNAARPPADTDSRQPRSRRGAGNGRGRSEGPAPAPAPISKPILKPAPLPPVADDDAYESENDRPLGRALFADVADDLEIPTYRPRLAVPPAARPAPAAQPEPVRRTTPVTRQPAAQPEPEPVRQAVPARPPVTQPEPEPARRAAPAARQPAARTPKPAVAPQPRVEAPAPLPRLADTEDAPPARPAAKPAARRPAAAKPVAEPAPARAEAPQAAPRPVAAPRPAPAPVKPTPKPADEDAGDFGAGLDV